MQLNYPFHFYYMNQKRRNTLSSNYFQDIIADLKHNSISYDLSSINCFSQRHPIGVHNYSPLFLIQTDLHQQCDLNKKLDLWDHLHLDNEIYSVT